jgi:gamma-glutamylcyclotransferase (GGCT)/AIG2-like uncharacterized protein YtfP
VRANPAAVQIFAYGTLKDPARLAAVIGATSLRVVDPGHVGGVLYDMGAFPALRRSTSPSDSVPGLLLELDDHGALERLDAYEDVGSGLHVRERCAVRLEDGQRRDAWVYVYNRSTAGRRRIAAWPPDRDYNLRALHRLVGGNAAGCSGSHAEALGRGRPTSPSGQTDPPGSNPSPWRTPALQRVHQ